MAKRIVDDSTEEEEVKSEEIEEEPKAKTSVSAARAKASAPKVLLRSRWPGKILVTEAETPSGNSYLFEKGGEVLVAAEDAESLLARRRSVGCCGSGRAEEPFFELV